MLSDIKIAQACIKKNINEIASLANIDEEYLENYGKYKAKVDYKLLKDLKDKKNGKSLCGGNCQHCGGACSSCHSPKS